MERERRRESAVEGKNPRKRRIPAAAARRLAFRDAFPSSTSCQCWTQLNKREGWQWGVTFPEALKSRFLRHSTLNCRCPASPMSEKTGSFGVFGVFFDFVWLTLKF
eukprot:394524-Rhodomonas_salina.1